ncbi:MAG: TetR/AcrR family transcriptional regulator, partial [Clostridia bacterium]|nr:TetR/AcrR family transcriptional regulator [Clostridia bacterium]
MPPKVKITKEEIIQTALSLVCENGEQAINARAIAAALHCSTQPIFFNFATMKELQNAVLQAAYERYLLFLKNEVEEGK